MEQVIDFFRQLLESEQFMPRWVCGKWTPFHGWLYVISDLTIFFAYMAIPFGLVYFVRKRWEDLPFRWVFHMFIAFIALCGTTHLIDALIFWIPIYRVNAIVLLATAIVSVITVIGVLKILPQAIKLEGPTMLKNRVDEQTKLLEKANRNLEKRVRERTKRMQEAQAIAGLGSWELNPSDQSITWSDELYLIYGKDRSFKPDLSNATALLSEQERKKVTEVIDRAIMTKEPWDRVYTYDHPSEGLKYLRSRGKVITKKGEVVKLIGTVQDVTKDKLTQEAVIENELMLSSLLRSATDAIVVSDDQGKVLKWNLAAEGIFGWTENEMKGGPMENIMPEKYRSNHSNEIQRYVESGDARIIGRTVEIEGLRKDGTVFPVEISFGTWQIEGRHYFCGIIRDVSDRKKAESELIRLKDELEKRVVLRTEQLFEANQQLQVEIDQNVESQQDIARLAAIVQTSDDSILSLTPDGTITSWNKGATRLYGYQQNEVIGENIRMFYLEDQMQELENMLSELKSGNTVENLETQRVRKDGGMVHISITYSPIRNAEGEVVGISGIARDIGHKIKAELEQQRLMTELSKTNKELENFAYIASHDLKAPLRAIGSLSDWIYADYVDKMDDDGREHLILLKSRVQRMHDLIEGILHYSRVGRKDGEQIEVDLNKGMNEVLDLVHVPAHVTLNVMPDLPTIVAYRTHPIQIFENLISNAVKYGDKENGVVDVGFEEIPRFWKFYVRDNGPGIDKRYHEKIFEIFQTLSARDDFESTGIGLTIVKKIVEHAGGQIWLESEKGKGSTFFFTIPKT